MPAECNCPETGTMIIEGSFPALSAEINEQICVTLPDCSIYRNPENQQICEDLKAFCEGTSEMTGKLTMVFTETCGIIDSTFEYTIGNQTISLEEFQGDAELEQFCTGDVPEPTAVDCGDLSGRWHCVFHGTDIGECWLDLTTTSGDFAGSGEGWDDYEGNVTYQVSGTIAGTKIDGSVLEDFESYPDNPDYVGVFQGDCYDDGRIIEGSWDSCDAVNAPDNICTAFEYGGEFSASKD